MECGGVFWNKQPQNLTWIANKPWQIDSGRLCISATATKRQTVYRLMLLQLNVQICTAAFWPRTEEETSDTPHWNACYLLLVFIGCHSSDKVALAVWRETEKRGLTFSDGECELCHCPPHHLDDCFTLPLRHCAAFLFKGDCVCVWGESAEKTPEVVIVEKITSCFYACSLSLPVWLCTIKITVMTQQWLC